MKHLKEVSTLPGKSAPSKESAKKKLKTLLKELSRLQHKMYAVSDTSLLIIMQWMDASGKDGAITKVFGAGVNPMWCSVKSFGVPTKEESSHDFLWRIHAQAPAKGQIKIFNRSHYEDLVMPLMSDTISKKDYEQRVQDVKAFEKLLVDNGTHIIKIYFHISPEAQKQRLEERLVDKEKHRKHKDGDRDKAAKFDQYLDVFSKVLEDTNFSFAKWNVLPADENWYKVLQVAQMTVDEIHDMRLKWPELQTEMHLITPHLEEGDKKKAKKKDGKKDEKKSQKEQKADTKDVKAAPSSPAKKSAPAKKAVSVKKSDSLPRNADGSIKGSVKIKKVAEEGKKVWDLKK